MSRPTILISAVACFLCISAACWMKSCEQEPVRFRSIAECRGALESLGYHCAICQTSPPICVASVRRLTDEEAVTAQHDHFATPWKGVVVVFPFRPRADGDYRVWGNVYATGDGKMLDAIDEHLIK